MNQNVKKGKGDNMEVSVLKEKLKEKLGRGASFKDFWKEHLIGIIEYQYFLNQINGSFRLDDEVRKIIEEYLRKG